MLQRHRSFRTAVHVLVLLALAGFPGSGWAGSPPALVEATAIEDISQDFHVRGDADWTSNIDLTYRPVGGPACAGDEETERRQYGASVFPGATYGFNRPAGAYEVTISGAFPKFGTFQVCAFATENVFSSPRRLTSTSTLTVTQPTASASLRLDSGRDAWRLGTSDSVRIEVTSLAPRAV